MARARFVIVVARNEAERIARTLTALARTFPEARLLLADDGSTDATAQIARELGVPAIGTGSHLGKGAAATLAVRAALAEAGGGRAGGGAVVVLCDGDLGDSAAELVALARAVCEEGADVAVARFRRRAGGGFGLVVAVARLLIRRGCGFEAAAPLSGQRALRADVLRELLPFAEGFGMEVGMTIDAVRAGRVVREVELELAHRATGRTAAGFAHRARQLRDVVRAYRARGDGSPSAARVTGERVAG